MFENILTLCTQVAFNVVWSEKLKLDNVTIIIVFYQQRQREN